MDKALFTMIDYYSKYHITNKFSCITYSLGAQTSNFNKAAESNGLYGTHKQNLTLEPNPGIIPAHYTPPLASKKSNNFNFQNKRYGYMKGRYAIYAYMYTKTLKQ